MKLPTNNIKDLMYSDASTMMAMGSKISKISNFVTGGGRKTIKLTRSCKKSCPVP